MNFEKFFNLPKFSLKRINVLEAENLQDSLLPLIYMSIPFGVAPRLPNMGKFLQFLSIVFSLIAVAFCVISIGLFIMIITQLIKNDILRKFIIDIPTLLTTCIGVFTIMACVATHLPYRRNITFANIIETLARYDEDLKMDKARYHSKTKRLLSAIMVGIPVWYFAVLGWTSVRSQWPVIFVVIPSVMILLTVIQYNVAAALLKQRFKLINKNLMNAFGHADIADEDLSAFDVTQMSSVSIFHGIIKNKRMMQNEGRLLEILDLLQESHSTLAELIDDVNSVYAISNISIILGIVVACTRNVYTIIKFIFVGYKTTAFENLIMLLASFTMDLTKIFVYAIVCGDATAVARRPLALVQTLKLHLGADQQKVGKRLDLFARHIQNMSFNFTAYSMVTFDISLLGEVLTTVVMYVIILVQFVVSNVSMTTMIPTTPETFQNSTSIYVD